MTTQAYPNPRIMHDHQGRPILDAVIVDGEMVAWQTSEHISPLVALDRLLVRTGILPDKGGLRAELRAELTSRSVDDLLMDYQATAYLEAVA